MHRSKFFAITLTIAATCFGFYTAMRSMGGLVFFTMANSDGSRNPAAIGKTFDFSSFEGGVLRVASQRRLVTDAKFLQQADRSIGMEFGHFVTRGPDGQKQFACGFYNRLQITFTAEGISEGGEKPTMEIEAPCEISQDVNRMSPIWVPVQKILNQKPGTLELTYPDIGSALFKFDNMPSEWPHQWRLSGLRFYNVDHSERNLTISEVDLKDLLSEPLQLNW